MKSKRYELAKKEVELANRLDGCGYERMVRESALHLLKTLVKENPTIFSVADIEDTFLRLVHDLPLTPLTDENADWQADGWSGRCRRVYRKKDKDGNYRYYDVDRTIIDDGESIYQGSDSKIVDKFFPITLPYYPPIKPYKLKVEYLLVDEKEGDYDTKGYLYIIQPDGTKFEVNEYYKYISNQRVQITKAEYEDRKEHAINKK